MVGGTMPYQNSTANILYPAHTCTTFLWMPEIRSCPMRDIWSVLICTDSNLGRTSEVDGLCSWHVGQHKCIQIMWSVHWNSRDPAPCQDGGSPLSPLRFCKELVFSAHPCITPCVWYEQVRAVEETIPEGPCRAACKDLREEWTPKSTGFAQELQFSAPPVAPSGWPPSALQIWLMIAHTTSHQQGDSLGALSFAVPSYHSAELPRSWHSENMKKIKALFKHTGQSYAC